MVVEIIEKTEAIKELLLLIEDTNEMIRRNVANGSSPTGLQVSGYERIRQELIGDLIELLNEFNVPLKFQPETTMQTALAA
jgi:hypothetical protein